MKISFMLLNNFDWKTVINSKWIKLYIEKKNNRNNMIDCLKYCNGNHARCIGYNYGNRFVKYNFVKFVSNFFLK